MSDASAPSTSAPAKNRSNGNGNADIAKVLDLGVQAATAYQRPDLADRLQRLRRNVGKPDVQVVVVGEFKQGKSSLINALVNAKVCPVDDDIATAVPTVIRYGDEKKAKAFTTPIDAPASEASEFPIPFEEVPKYATELGSGDPSLAVKGVEIELPRKLLGNGLVLVDTPGVGGLGSAHATAALGALSVADAALFISDASQEFTRAEIDFLKQASDLCPQVVCLMTKTDFYPAWRRVLELNQGHLRNEGFSLQIIPVSSLLRTEAVRRNDRELNAESGFAELVRTLNTDVVGGAAKVLRRRAHQDLVGVCDQLAGQFEAERSALNDPENAAEIVNKLEQTKGRSEELRGALAKWSTTLTDGVADLNADIDFDFRQRIRTITAEADAAIANSDPLDTWAEFEPWLVNRVSYDVVSNYRYLTERAGGLSEEVSSHFELAGGELLEGLDIHNPTAVLARVGADPDANLEGTTAGAKGLTMLRGGYSGFLMFSLVGSLILPVLWVPAGGTAIGLLMGRKTLKDEKERQLTQRRAQARNSVRRYCDEVSFEVNKDSRDTLRRIQRQMRDHYSSRAEELHKSTAEALKAANDAAKRSVTERAQRLKDVDAELARIKGLRDQVQTLVAPKA
jgi:GTPase SAR1 family protein